MKSLIVTLIIAWFSFSSQAQNRVRFLIQSSENKEPLIGATIQVANLKMGSVANETGVVELRNIPDGKQSFVVSFVGYKQQIVDVTFPISSDEAIIVELQPEEEELEEVVITTTRSSRHIENLPTRVEFIGGEELGEKITMQPGNIRMVLSESTGIQTQQTSVSSANATIRIQGLDGRYTQILKDGFPLYAGFSGGLSIMQIPPLDLKQVDVIKGSASTLYGGGAIAGLINLISKVPTDERELSFLVNGTTARGLDMSSFYSQKFKKIGITFFASHNYNKEYDPADIGFSAIPNYKRFTANPRLFFYMNERTTLTIGLNAAFENRIGGDMMVLAGKANNLHTYFEKNKTNRVSSQISFQKQINDHSSITVKNSINHFKRNIAERNYQFGGAQLSSFTEASYSLNSSKSDWVMGVNAWTDLFDEEKKSSDTLRNYSTTTVGAFVQNILTLSKVLSVETGLRLDYVSAKAEEEGALQDVFLLPRASLLFQITPKFASRVGGGLGYKTPSIFTEKAEEQVFNKVRPIDFSKVKSEKSYGANVDFNYHTNIGEHWSVTLNQLFFYTKIQTPLVFNQDSLMRSVYYFENAAEHLDAMGTESNVKLAYENFKLFFGYTFVNAESHFKSERRAIPLTAKNRINSMLMYEEEGKWRIGFEGFYFGSQQLSSGVSTNDYWIFGFSAQRSWKQFSLFINFENFTDTRQTRFGSVYSGSISNPQFSEIYAPLDGFVSNLGFILKL